MFSHLFHSDFGGSGDLEIDQNGAKWLSKSVRDGSWTQNMHLGGSFSLVDSSKRVAVGPVEGARGTRGVINLP